MSPEDRARAFEGVDWRPSPSMPSGAPVPADDDSADLISSDLRYAATFLGAVVLIVAVGIAVRVVL